MASSVGRRIFGFTILIACLLVIGGGAWYLWGRAYFADETASDDDDDEDDDDIVTDGGARRPAKPGKPKKKKGSGRASKPSVPRRASAPAGGPVGPGGPSYESAIAGNHEQVSIGAAGGAPDLSDAQLAGPMRNGTFLDACGAPESMHVTVKVAIRGGRAVGVSVYTTPPSPGVAGCVDRAVRGLAWPVNAKLDSFVTTY
jgi:hypothetical protein